MVHCHSSFRGGRWYGVGTALVRTWVLPSVDCLPVVGCCLYKLLAVRLLQNADFRGLRGENYVVHDIIKVRFSLFFVDEVQRYVSLVLKKS